jgi:DNA-binding response OmpR family regulator
MTTARTESSGHPSITRIGRRAIGDVELDLDGCQFRVCGVLVRPPLKELQVLGVLMDHAGTVLTRQQILDLAWEPGYADRNNTVDVHIKRLRRRIAGCGSSTEHIRTVRNLGYVFDLPDAQQVRQDPPR